MTKSFTLEDLLTTIEKQASEADESKEKKEVDSKSGDTSGNDDTSKKESDKENKEEGQEKSASDAGAALAKEVFEKVASIKTTQKGNEMNKQASVAGKALADAILTKLASAGDMSTDNGVTPGTTPQKNIVDNAAMMAQDDAKIQALPGTDGAGNGGTVNQIFDSIVQDAMSEGATDYNQANASQAEGKANQQGSMSGAVGVDDSQEKMAAVMTLVENGMDFDSAVNLVKEAELAIAVEEDAHTKQAAVSELIAEGFDFDTAVDLVKEAGRIDSAKAAVGKAFGAVKSEAKDLGAAVRGLKTAPRMAGAAIARNKVAQGVAAAGVVGGAAAAMREKKAAFEALVDAGVDFEKAAELVAAKSQELYGV